MFLHKVKTECFITGLFRRKYPFLLVVPQMSRAYMSLPRLCFLPTLLRYIISSTQHLLQSTRDTFSFPKKETNPSHTKYTYSQQKNYRQQLEAGVERNPSHEEEKETEGDKPYTAQSGFQADYTKQDTLLHFVDGESSVTASRGYQNKRPSS